MNGKGMGPKRGYNNDKYRSGWDLAFRSKGKEGLSGGDRAKEENRDGSKRSTS